MTAFLLTLWTKIQGWAYLALGVLALLVGAYAYGASRAKKAAELKSAAQDAARERAARESLQKAIKDRTNVEQNVGRLPPGGAAKQLHDNWSTDE